LAFFLLAWRDFDSCIANALSILDTGRANPAAAPAFCFHRHGNVPTISRRRFGADVAHRTDRGPSYEDDGVEPRVVLRVGFWLLAAGATTTVLILAANTPNGQRRISAAWSELSTFPVLAAARRPPFATAEQAAPANPEIDRLSDTVRQLTADRDRLLARLEALEKAEATGSIAPARSAAQPEAAAAPAVRAAPAAAPASDDPTEVPASRAAFAVDLGSTPNLDAMRGLWLTLKAKHGGMLEGLRPLAAIRESGGPGSVALHLIAGPLPSANAAARLCLILSSMGERCETAAFEGQRLALR
jgi:hypothetical protein